MVIDGDGHCNEPSDLFDRYLEKEFRERGPKVVDASGTRWMIEGKFLPRPVGTWGHGSSSGYFGTNMAKKGMATPAFKAVGDDLAKFATGGLLGMVAVETGDKGTAPCPALVTVIYNTPKDSGAFESYYSASHLPLVGAGQSEIGFTRADLTRFESNLDGSAPAKYRQAELCFNSMDDLKKGVASPAFKKVGDDLGKFATGGLTALIGEQQ